MSLTSVKMSEEVWLTCLTHALSTETEEIMDLLLGDIQSKNGQVTALIWGALPQPRCDRQKDRVETNPEQLSAASIYADKMSIATGTTTRVIGWYHSHPHITVLPSHVDVRTQATYQLLDPGFIGLIFSCFSEDAQKVGRIQVTAFQSLDGKQNQISLSTVLDKGAVIDLESSPSSSDNTFPVFGSSKGDIIEKDTADSRAVVVASKGRGRKSRRLGGFFANSDAGKGNGFKDKNLNNTVGDLDPMDVSEGLQEALRLSNMESSRAEFVRKEIPLHVLPMSSLISLDSPLSSFTKLQQVLFEEEKGVYNQAIIQNTRDDKVHPLSIIHHASTYRASLCKMIEYCLNPAMIVLQDRVRENEIQLKLLAEEAQILESELSRGSPSNSSPRHSPSQRPSKQRLESGSPT